MFGPWVYSPCISGDFIPESYWALFALRSVDSYSRGNSSVYSLKFKKLCSSLLRGDLLSFGELCMSITISFAAPLFVLILGLFVTLMSGLLKGFASWVKDLSTSKSFFVYLPVLSAVWSRLTVLRFGTLSEDFLKGDFAVEFISFYSRGFNICPSVISFIMAPLSIRC